MKYAGYIFALAVCGLAFWAVQAEHLDSKDALGGTGFVLGTILWLGGLFQSEREEELESAEEVA